MAQGTCSAMAAMLSMAVAFSAPWCALAVRMGALRAQQCDVRGWDRHDCGHFGIDQWGCESKGCCWREAEVQGAPWCFKPAGEASAPSTGGEACAQQDAGKVECGFLGIGKQGCESRGCCWDESRDGAPWCFKQRQASEQGGSTQQGQCAQVRDSERRDCGFFGVSKESCEAKQCCWVPSSSGAPWCFHQVAAPQPSWGQGEDKEEPKRKPDRHGAESGLDLPAAHPKGSSMAFVHLFEWKWDDVARECEDFLGPKGYAAVQVSPPNEHIQGEAWWTRYQPVSYKLVSRSGDEAAFASMVKRCSAAGVGIYIDAVINHMASGGGVGTAGSHYGGRSFPQFSPRDFHHEPGNEQRNCEVNNYNDKHNVQYCDLVGLADLRTGSSYVQEQIAAYINRMVGFGVAGFRIDAAKHIDAGELRGILQRVDSRLFRFLEVIGHGGEAVGPRDYFELGSITEFNYAIELGAKFQRQGELKWLRSFGEKWGLMPTGLAVTFVDNHDTQRGHAGNAALTHKWGAVYTLANIFMLAHPYGYPKVMSSYHFDNSNQGPPHQGVHNHWGLNCGHGKQWACEHRRPEIANMVAWRASAGEAGIDRFHDHHHGSAIAFCRGGRACVAINRHEGETWELRAEMSMPPGEYCNIMVSDSPSSCKRVTVHSGGSVRISVPPMSAVAFHVGVRAA